MKFNISNKEKNTTLNHEGAKAYKMTPEYELYTTVVTTGLSNTFYEAADTKIKRIQNLIQQCSPEFVAKLAIYTRKDMYMRSIPLVLIVELAKVTSGNTIVSKMIDKIVLRADEITELLAYYQMANERTELKKLNKLSKQIQKGLVYSFNKFDEYQFGKYNTKSEITLKDALFLVHPKPKDEKQQLLFDKIVTNSLATPYTWETELSELGKNQFKDKIAKKEAFTRKWEELIESKKLGYMALLRNLRNILEANVSSVHIDMVCNHLANENAVANSKQLPFRYLAAYRELKDSNSKYASVVLNALEEAVVYSAATIKGFESNTSVVIACDVSGSMQQPISARSKILLYDIGLMLGMLLQSKCKNVISGMFGDKWKIINMPRKAILSNVNEYYKREGEVGYSTNGYLVLEDLIARKEITDKVMLFTDVQLWNSNGTNYTFQTSWMEYKKIAPQAKLYVFDLAGYGKALLPVNIQQNDVYLIAGWSDKIFDVLEAMENTNSALDYIHKIEL